MLAATPSLGLAALTAAVGARATPVVERLLKLDRGGDGSAGGISLDEGARETFAVQRLRQELAAKDAQIAEVRACDPQRLPSA